MISVVIVNYNVKYFLQQCLRSVFDAAVGLDVEVWVVDNNSSDGSVQMVHDHFPQVHLIANSDNPGFAKANNQALKAILNNPPRQQSANIQQSIAPLPDLVLLLNPDTLVQRDTFRTCLDFYYEHPDCGGLTVKMINGDGIFLKESKRGFPSPATSFFKISGLIKLFPHNKKVGAYYMGHLDDNTVNEVDVLPGAFLMISREALQKTGFLDESYFMYGEDIDFSWRIHLAGYKNYYLPTTRILHYKGESTRKSSMNYVYTFYNAMAIFARKYFSKGGAKYYNILIQCAIWLRASIDFVQRIASYLAVPLLDFVAALAGFQAIRHIWATYWAENVNYYSDLYIWCILPIYVIILLLTSWLAGGYDKPLRLGRIVQGMGFGALCLLVFYSLLGEELRFSRAIVLLGSVWSIFSTLAIRGLLNLAGVKGYRQRSDTRRRYLIVGSEAEYQRITSLFDNLGIEPRSIERVQDIASVEMASKNVDEIIFSGKDVSISDMLDITQKQGACNKEFRRAPEDMEVLIGSNYTVSVDDLYTPDFGNITNPTNRRTKRLFDITSALLVLMLSPLLFWPQRRKRRFFSDCLSVLLGRKSWIGYSSRSFSHSANNSKQAGEPLPNIKRGIFKTCDRLPNVKNPDLMRLDHDYATNYHLSTDITILMINIFKI